MQQNIMSVPTFKLSFQVQFFAETYFRVFKSLAKIAKIRFSRKFPLIRYMLPTLFHSQFLWRLWGFYWTTFPVFLTIHLPLCEWYLSYFAQISLPSPMYQSKNVVVILRGRTHIHVHLYNYDISVVIQLTIRIIPFQWESVLLLTSQAKEIY